MRVIARKTLMEFIKKHPDAKSQLDTWYKKIREDNSSSSQELQEAFKSTVRIIKGNRACFKIKGNAYRLVVAINYKKLDDGESQVLIKFIGTHAEYDKIDAETVNLKN